MAIELKEGMTLVCKTANGKTFTVGEKYPVIKSDSGDLYIQSENVRWFNGEMRYLEANGDIFEVLPYTPNLSKLEEVECVAEDQDAWSFVKGKKYKVHHDECEPYILSDKGARFRQENLEHLAKHYDVRFEEPKQEPVTELKTPAFTVHVEQLIGERVNKRTYFKVTSWTWDIKKQCLELNIINSETVRAKDGTTVLKKVVLIPIATILSIESVPYETSVI